MDHIAPKRRIPEGEFVVRIDEMLEKWLPEKTIPWPASSPPVWARGFQPRTIVDLGTGVGGFTRSVLSCLGQWGCLEGLERLVLIESDETLSPSGKEGLHRFLLTKARETLDEAGRTDVVVEVVTAPVQIDGEEGNREGMIRVLEPYPEIDLLVASHITYYFGDGSGRELLLALRRYLSLTGRLWCVIRRQECPIYQARAKTLATLGYDEIKPFDYAEYFEQSVLPAFPEFVILGAADKGYLADPSQPVRADAAYFLMWREEPQPPCDTPYWQAIDDIVSESVPLFVERHFILERSRR
jgi:hypothetical protein